MIGGLIYSVGRIPLLGPLLRRSVRRHPEGSTATIRFGLAAGLKWKRYSRFVSGYALGIYEPGLQKAIARELKPSQVFYDVGANAGFFSLLASRLAGPAGKVFAFEPLPSNYEVAREQIQINALANVELITAAVGSASGKAILQADGPATARLTGGVNGKNAGTADASIGVDVISLDDFIRVHPKPDLVKIDVEGFEADVLEGASSLLGADGPVLIIEIHNDEASRRVQKTLRDNGYRLADLIGNALPDGGPDVSRPSHIVAYPARRAATAGASLRILYAGDLSFGGTCLMRLEAMRSMGHTVTPVDLYRHDLSGVRLFAYKVAYRLRRQIDFTGANEQFKRLCGEQAFDLLWIDKGNTIRPATLARVRELQPQAVIAGYSPDDMGASHNNTVNFVRSLAFHDVYFTTKSYGVSELAALGCPKVLFSGNAYDEAIHRPMTLEGADVEKFSADVGFIGSYEQDRAEQILYLDRQGFGVRIHGSMWDEFLKAKELSIPPRAPVFNENYTKAICGAKINLCFLRKMNRDLQTQRSVEIPACGAFMLAERTDEHRGLFEEGKEAEFFSSKEELVEKVRHYLAHPDDRRRIADAGRERCLRSGYSYHDRIRQMLAQVDEIARSKQLVRR